jgi:hypothetical protein
MGKKILSCILVHAVNTSNEATCCCCLNFTSFHSALCVFAVVMLVVDYLEGQLYLIYVIW